MLFTASWWKYAGSRAGRTALGMMVTFAATFVATGNVVPMALAGAFGAITSLASSLRGLREVSGENIPRWQAILTRCAWSLGQGLVTGFGTAAILTEVDWNATWQAAASGVVTSLILGLLSALPETAEVVTQVPESGVLPASAAMAGVAVVPEGTGVYSAEESMDVTVEGQESAQFGLM